MKKILFEDISTKIEELYVNLFLIAIDRGYNLRSIVNEIAGKINKYYESKTGIFVPRGFEGLLFASTVAKSMGSSLTEALYLSEVEKKLMLYKLVEKMDRQWLTPSEYNNDEYEGTTTIDYLYSYEDNYGNDACFKLTFVKNQNEEGVIKYSVEATITKEGENFGVDTDLMYDSLIIWEEETGEVASFVESVIDYYVNNEEDQEDDVDEYEPEDKKELQKPDTVLNVEAPTTEDDRIIVGHKKPEVIDDKTGKRIIDELVVYISNDTKSVSLLDKFEGYGENQ
ncbi:MAG: hypothetical protein J6N21_03430, partial [Butyrivibrio sp.]|nr:hypothetical protein [Butyrivibrio sp.]